MIEKFGIDFELGPDAEQRIPDAADFVVAPFIAGMIGIEQEHPRRRGNEIRSDKRENRGGDGAGASAQSRGCLAADSHVPSNPAPPGTYPARPRFLSVNRASRG